MNGEPKNRRQAAIAALERTIGHVFADRDLLERALTHASAAGVNPKVRHYERLEFLGDRVLGLCAAERLLALDPDAREGAMSIKLHALVNGKACARVARRVGLGPALRLAPGQTELGGRDNDSILGDACEALMAALYIEAGMDCARAFFARFWADEFADLDERVGHPKTQLQEWAMARSLPLPVYDVISRAGPPHAPEFKVRVSLDGFPDETGQGRSRAAAERAAAQQMLIRREGAQ